MTALASAGAPSRRDEIVDIARGIFAERGYSSTSMRDIAEASGLMAGSLYSHFRSKAEILRLVLSPVVDELEPGQEAVLASDACGLARFEQMVHTVLGILELHRDETTIMHYDWSELSETPELTDLAQRSNHLLTLWQQVIVAGQQDGSIRPDVRPELVVRVVTSALHASVDSKRYAHQALPARAAQGRPTVADELTMLFASGIGTPAGVAAGASGASGVAAGASGASGVAAGASGASGVAAGASGTSHAPAAVAATAGPATRRPRSR